MDDEDDDEETLQLKLQELQARLKLKKLQNAKAKEFGIIEAKKRSEGLRLGSSISNDRRPPTREEIQRPASQAKDENLRPSSQPDIQVPASPIRKIQLLQAQTSPRRVQLGIDKGLSAKDVSLKRAPGLNNLKRNPVQETDSYLRTGSARTPTESATPARPLTFSERLASARSEDVSNAERQKRIKKSRTKAFGIGQEEMEKYKSRAVDIPDEPQKTPSFTREEVLGKKWSSSGGIPRSSTTPNLSTPFDDASLDESASFEAYSGLHLSRCILPHRVLARHITGKKVMNIKDLFKEVKAPDYQLPDVEQDIVIFGIIAKKSDPRAHKPATAKNGLEPQDRGKYMVVSLVDLDYEVDLFLFNTGFDRFWKLTEGTVVAILNPNVMPPPPGRQDTGRFSLVINSDEDTIIEIGLARDLGYCQSVKKDGDSCGTWINKKRTQFCEYHSNEAVKKAKQARVEMNTSGFGTGKAHRIKTKKDSGYKKGPSNYDWETKTSFFVSRSMSAADLIDGKNNAADRKEKEENLKRRLAQQEKERDIMKKLGRVGGGAGREYMQRSGSKTANTSISSQAEPEIDLDAVHKAALSSLNLGAKDRTIQLSSIKRKRADSSQAGTMTSKTSTAYGWGSDLKGKLSRMKDGEKLRKETEAPLRKKTRFVTEKGIREAGRESFGGELEDRRVVFNDDDDDDELVIVK